MRRIARSTLLDAKTLLHEPKTLLREQPHPEGAAPMSQRGASRAPGTSPMSACSRTGGGES